MHHFKTLYFNEFVMFVNNIDVESRSIISFFVSFFFLQRSTWGSIVIFRRASIVIHTVLTGEGEGE